MNLKIPSLPAGALMILSATSTVVLSQRPSPDDPIILALLMNGLIQVLLIYMVDCLLHRVSKHTESLLWFQDHIYERPKNPPDKYSEDVEELNELLKGDIDEIKD